MAQLAQLHEIRIPMDTATDPPAISAAPQTSHETKPAETGNGVCSFQTQHTVPIRGLSIAKDGKVIIGDKKGWITVVIWLGE